MESSEEEEDFPSLESITPQSKVDSLYQSHTEKVCFLLFLLLPLLVQLMFNMSEISQTHYVFTLPPTFLYLNQSLHIWVSLVVFRSVSISCFGPGFDHFELFESLHLQFQIDQRCWVNSTDSIPFQLNLALYFMGFQFLWVWIEETVVVVHLGKVWALWTLVPILQNYMHWCEHF